MASGAGGAKQRLMAELQGLQKEKWVEIEVRWLRLLHSPPRRRGEERRRLSTLPTQADNLFRWRLALMVINPDSVFNGGYFKVGQKVPRRPEV